MSPVSAYVPPASSSSTVTAPLIDPAGTPTVGTETVVATVPAGVVSTQYLDIVDGRVSNQFLLIDGQDETDMAAWPSAVRQAINAQTEANEVLLAVTVDPSGSPTVNYFPIRGVTVEDQPNMVTVVWDTTVVQRPWSVGVAEVDSAFAALRTQDTLASEQTALWGNESGNPEVQLGFLIVEAATVPGDVTLVQDSGLRQVVADGFQSLETAVLTGDQPGRTLPFAGQVVIDSSPKDVRAAIEAEILAADMGQKVDWNGNVVGLSFVALGPLDLTINGVTDALVAGESLTIAAQPSTRDVYQSIVVEAPANTVLKYRFQLRLA
jgi:hypothetical protein